MRKKKKHTGYLAWVFAIFVAIGALAACVWIVDNRMEAFTKDAVLKISPEMDAEDVMSLADSLLVPRHSLSLRRVLTVEMWSHSPVPGSYVIERTFSARKFARMITRGWESPVNLVLAGRLRTLGDLASRISAQMMTDSASMMAVLEDTIFLKSLGIPEGHIFEYIIPDTYQIYWTSSPSSIVRRLKSERDGFWTEDRMAAAAAQGLTPSQVSVLASIVCEESSRPDEYPKIASVYITRFHRGMKLQACPTVCYLTGYRINRVLKKHLAIDSPYNTYIYEGLPPAPICIPGKEHLEAVLNPDASEYLYFCADWRLNGRNVFSRTYGEHLKNASLYRGAISGGRRVVSKANGE